MPPPPRLPSPSPFSSLLSIGFALAALTCLSQTHTRSEPGGTHACDILENGGLRAEVGSGIPETSGLLSLFLVSLSVKWVEY